MASLVTVYKLSPLCEGARRVEARLAAAAAEGTPERALAFLGYALSHSHRCRCDACALWGQDEPQEVTL